MKSGILDFERMEFCPRPLQQGFIFFLDFECPFRDLVPTSGIGLVENPNRGRRRFFVWDVPSEDQLARQDDSLVYTILVCRFGIIPFKAFVKFC